MDSFPSLPDLCTELDCLIFLIGCLVILTLVVAFYCFLTPCGSYAVPTVPIKGPKLEKIKSNSSSVDILVQ